MTMFYRKMVGHTGNDKLNIHCFQESLTGSAAKWYMKLDCDQIHTWTDLVKAFLAQYDHVVDIAHDHMALMTMEKKETESFKEYAHIWQDVASQVQPPLTKKETTFIFVNTLLGLYYEKMIGNAIRNFAKMVWS